MIDLVWLQRGIFGLANASKAGTMAGHLGAALAAGYFFGEDNAELPKPVFTGIEGELKRILAGEESFWWNAKQAGVTTEDLFAAFPDEPSEPDRIAAVADALKENVGITRQSGHNIIFAAIAIRGLHDHPEFATASIIAGLEKLTRAFNTAHAGRGYFGTSRGWLSGTQFSPGAETDFPVYVSVTDMVRTTIDELIRSAAVKRQGFGGLWHIINHAAAIAELDRMGCFELARLALPAHHYHIRLWRSLPDVSDELGAVVRSRHDPRDPAYWDDMLKRDEARLTHRIKTLYGYFTLRQFIEAESQRTAADDAFLCLMA